MAFVCEQDHSLDVSRLCKSGIETKDDPQGSVRGFWVVKPCSDVVI